MKRRIPHCQELRMPQEDPAAVLDRPRADKRITRAQFATGVVDMSR